MDSGNKDDKRWFTATAAGLCGAIFALSLPVAANFSEGSVENVVISVVGYLAGFATVLIFTHDLLEGHQRLRVALNMGACLLLAAGVGWLFGSAASSPDRTGSPAYAGVLGRSFRELNESRAAAYVGLAGAKRRRAQASYASELQALFATEARQLRWIRVRPADLAVTRQLAAALARSARAYSHLSATATDPKGSQDALDAAREAVDRAGKLLWNTEQRLAKVGYSVEALPSAGKAAQVQRSTQNN